MKIKPETILKILELILVGVIIWYNTNVYNAYRIGILQEEWYLIFLIVPLLVLITNYLIVKKFHKIRNTTGESSYR